MRGWNGIKPGVRPMGGHGIGRAMGGNDIRRVAAWREAPWKGGGMRGANALAVDCHRYACP